MHHMHYRGGKKDIESERKGKEIESQAGHRKTFRSNTSNKKRQQEGKRLAGESRSRWMRYTYEREKEKEAKHKVSDISWLGLCVCASFCTGLSRHAFTLLQLFLR